MRDPDTMRAWQRLTPELTTSGVIGGDDVPRLAALGVRHVINLAMPDHPDALVDEATALAAAGIGYTSIPIPFATPGESHFAAFCAAMETAPRPLHVHCIMNWRVSAMFYRWHRDIVGMAEAEARTLMERQWRPETNPYPGAAAWAAFIARPNRAA